MNNHFNSNGKSIRHNHPHKQKHRYIDQKLARLEKIDFKNKSKYYDDQYYDDQY